ncbi:MAG: YabN family protein [Limisphaerales bacterium]
MPKPPSRRGGSIRQLEDIMAILRSPEGCPWDREQDHRTLRWHAIEEVYELLDAIEAGDDGEMVEELGDLLLQVVFHCQLGRERGAFDLEAVARRVADKLIHRHPHVFGDVKVASVDEVWANWEKLKRVEKVGTRAERGSALDGVPRHLPALMRAEKLAKKARKAGLEGKGKGKTGSARSGRRRFGERMFDWVLEAQARGWSAEELLRDECARREKRWRTVENRGVTGSREVRKG